MSIQLDLRGEEQRLPFSTLFKTCKMKENYFSSDGLVWFYKPVDEHGQQVERTKDKYPYSYDGFVTWRGGKNKEANGTVYCDRMWQSDWDKYNRCTKEVFGDNRQMFYNSNPKDIEKLLQLYFESPELRLILIMEYCNVSNGYPVWRFDYHLPKQES